jgi:hypothetical protein
MENLLVRLSSGSLKMGYNTKVGIRFNGAYRLLSAVLIAELLILNYIK